MKIVFEQALTASDGGAAAMTWSSGSAGVYLVRTSCGGDLRTLRVVRTE